jgi:hydroxymethylpyrimidine/phosphomethylpyrimidine kinase
MAISKASGTEDVAAVEGRLVRSGSRAKACGSVRFGASGHVARVILSSISCDPEARSGMNIRFGEDVLAAVRTLGLSASHFSREEEPSASKTMSWGTQEAIRLFKEGQSAGLSPSGRLESVPAVIWDRGGPGKEPMVRLLGRSASGVAKVAVEIARRLSAGQEPIN